MNKNIREIPENREFEQDLFIPMVYEGDTFKIVLWRYSDPERRNLARNAAIYLGKKDRDNIKRPLNVIKMGHVPEVFRGEFAEFEFIDVSKEVYDHLVTYTTRKMRVAGGNRALTSDDFTMPSDKVKDRAYVRRKIEESMKNYQELLEAKETPQVARSAMPVNAKMNPFVISFNFVTLMQSVFPQRIGEKGAQGNTVKVVQGMYELVREVDPVLWDTANDFYGRPMLEWKEVRRKIRSKKLSAYDFALEIIKKKELDENFKGSESLEEILIEMYGDQKSMW